MLCIKNKGYHPQHITVLTIMISTMAMTWIYKCGTMRLMTRGEMKVTVKLVDNVKVPKVLVFSFDKKQHKMAGKQSINCFRLLFFFK